LSGWLRITSMVSHLATAMLHRKIVIRKTQLGYAQRCLTDRAGQQHLADFWHRKSHLPHEFAQFGGRFGQRLREGVV
jgi:hypothetical protein